MKLLNSILVEKIQNRVVDNAGDAYEIALARCAEARKEGRDPKKSAQDLEAVILTDWKYSVLYAAQVLEGRFSAFEFAVQEAEPAISPDDQLAIFHYILRSGSEWPEAEKHIIANADLAVRYAEQVAKRPWPADHPAHATIANNEAEWLRYTRAFDLPTTEFRL